MSDLISRLETARSIYQYVGAVYVFHELAFKHKFVLRRTQPDPNCMPRQQNSKKNNGYGRAEIGQVLQLEQCILENLRLLLTLAMRVTFCLFQVDNERVTRRRCSQMLV